jgi:hypothetical protein
MKPAVWVGAVRPFEPCGKGGVERERGLQEG